MKKLVGLFMLLFVFTFFGCGDDEVFYVTDDFLVKNNITDVAGVFEQKLVEDNTLVLYYGNRKEKDWFALFDAKSELLLDEWYGNERFYDNGGLTYMPSANIGLFKKLKNGEYIYIYSFDGVRQVVYLLPNKSVRYGFVVLEDMWIDQILEGKGFYDKRNSGDGSAVIYDFDGNICVTDVSVVEDPNLWYIGFQEEKVCIGIYDEKDNLQEVEGKEKFERNRKVHIGYGEYEEFYIKKIEKGRSIKTDWGYAFLPSYRLENGVDGSFDLFLIKEDGLIFIPLTRSSGSLRNWYNGSILVDGRYVFSSEGKSIVELSGLSDYDEPVSYEEVIRFTNVRIVARYDLTRQPWQNCVWKTKIDKLENIQSDAKTTMTILEKKGQLWSYRCNIINKDGSKSDFKFNLNVETGEVTYL